MTRLSFYRSQKNVDALSFEQQRYILYVQKPKTDRRIIFLALKHRISFYRRQRTILSCPRHYGDTEKVPRDEAKSWPREPVAEVPHHNILCQGVQRALPNNHHQPTPVPLLPLHTITTYSFRLSISPLPTHTHTTGQSGKSNWRMHRPAHMIAWLQYVSRR